MITVHHVRSVLVGSVALFAASTLAVVAAPGASARPAPPDATGAIPAPPAPVVQQIAYGSPLWTFVVVALVAVVVAVAVTLVIARRSTPAAAAGRPRNDARMPVGQR